MSAATPARAAPLPLGERSLPETRKATMLAPGVQLTRISRGTARRGPRWRVNVLAVDRSGGARLTSVLSNGRVPGRERVSAMARRTRALAAVNGGYFATSGDPVGVLVSGGRLVSEPVGSRSALLVPLSPVAKPRVSAVRFPARARVGERSLLLDGVDRPLGQVPGCGGRGGDRPTQRPSSTHTCTDSSELVAYSRSWGRRTPAERGAFEATVTGNTVRSVHRQGRTSIPARGYVLAGSGRAARLLRAHARAGVPVTLRTGLDAARYDAVVGGGPLLLRRGKVTLRAAVEGFFGSFVSLRSPRTLAGVTADGRVLLVTVDGRFTSWSAGVTLLEAARVMRSLGAREALNLDGGGSTAMAVRGKLVNRPSDGSERRVSDALAVLP